MHTYKAFRSLVILVIFLTLLPGFAFGKDTLKNENRTFTYQGYITNKVMNPIRLKVYKINEDFFYFEEKKLEDNSFVPRLNLELTAENTTDYSIILGNNKIFIPKGARFSGYISQIEGAKSFNRKGFFKVTFNKAYCPDGKVIDLQENLVSRSEDNVYNPLRHIGKTTFSLLGGSLAGALLTYQVGGLALAVATHGYSLAAGAAAGGFLGTLHGFTGEGKEPGIEPGADLTVIPVDDVSLIQLNQITCNELDEFNSLENNNKVKVDILSVKQKKHFLGDSVFKLNLEIKNDSGDNYRLSNFYLRDSQGNEYSASLVDVDEDILKVFPPGKKTKANLEFFVEYPNANHWLVLKNNTLSADIGSWKIEN